MPPKSTNPDGEGVHQSSRQLWLVAGLPALLVIAFLIYRAVVQSPSSASPDAPPTASPKAGGQ